MHQEEPSWRSPLSQSRLENFAQTLQVELTSVLGNLDLRPRAQSVRVLLQAGVERLSGAWPAEDITQMSSASPSPSRQWLLLASLTHALRKALSRDDAGTARLGRAVTKAWALCCRSESLPLLRSPGNSGEEKDLEASVLGPRPGSGTRKRRERHGLRRSA
eukprot:g8887.t1